MEKYNYQETEEFKKEQKRREEVKQYNEVIRGDTTDLPTSSGTKDGVNYPYYYFLNPRMSEQPELHKDLIILSQYCFNSTLVHGARVFENLEYVCSTEEQEKFIKTELTRICQKYGIQTVKNALRYYEPALEDFALRIFNDKHCRLASVNHKGLKNPNNLKIDLQLLSHMYFDRSRRKNAEEHLKHRDNELQNLIKLHGRNEIVAAARGEQYHPRMQKKLDELKRSYEIDNSTRSTKANEIKDLDATDDIDNFDLI